MAHRRPRWSVLVASPVVLLGLVAPHAHAAPVEDGQLSSNLAFQFNDVDCDRTLDGMTLDKTKQFDSPGTYQAAIDNKATVVDSDQSADTTTLRASARSRAEVSASGGSLDTAKLTSELEARHNSALGLMSVCATKVNAVAAATLDFTTKKKGRVVLTWSLAGRATFAVSATTSTGSYWAGGADTPGASGRAVIKVRAGTHALGTSLQTAITLGEAGVGLFTREGSATVKAVFKPAS